VLDAAGSLTSAHVRAGASSSAQARPSTDYAVSPGAARRRRTKEGLNKKDIMRCLMRFVAREVYRALTSTPTERITQNDLTPAA
jgi:hypothetical protein